MEILEAIKTALPVFAEHKGSDEEALEQALLSAGIPPALTIKLLGFMPLAFARVLMGGTGIMFQDYYLRYNYQTIKDQKRKLMDEPVYRESFELASYIAARKMAGEAFKAVAFRSPELAAVNEGLRNGSRPERMIMSPLVIIWDEEIEPPAEASGQKGTKKRWRFWE